MSFDSSQSQEQSYNQLNPLRFMSATTRRRHTMFVFTTTTLGRTTTYTLNTVATMTEFIVHARSTIIGIPDAKKSGVIGMMCVVGSFTMSGVTNESL